MEDILLIKIGILTNKPDGERGRVELPTRLPLEWACVKNVPPWLSGDNSCAVI